MKKLPPILSLALLIVITMYSCKKDSGSSGSIDNHVKLLTTGKWKLETVEYEDFDKTWTTNTDTQDIDFYTIEFHTDNTYLAVDENGDSGTGTWKFSSDYSQLALIHLVNGNNSTYTSGVSVLTSTELQLMPPDGYPGNDIAERDTFTHP